MSTNEEIAVRAIWDAKGVPLEKQDAMLADITAKAQPGAQVGPFIIVKTIDRNEAITKLVDMRTDLFDSEDITSAVEEGRYGYAEMPNEELAGLWLDFMGETVTVTGQEPTPMVEIPKADYEEMLEALKGLTANIDLSQLHIRKHFSLLNAHAFAIKLIAKAEGRG